jgi:hypothetical protein
MSWRESTYSGGGEGDTCVEIAPPHPHSHTRSKNPSHGMLSVPTGSFTLFIEALKAQHPWSDRGMWS